MVLAACVVAVVTMVGIAKLMESSRGATGASATPPAANSDTAAGTARAPATNIPAGKVTLGETHATSEIAAFWMDTTEVTTAAYAACVASGTCTKADTGGDCNAGAANRENHPINCVSWNQAKAYCEAQGQRLPTEEEWEYAATGGDGRTYPWGNDAPSDQLCWDGEGNDLGKANRQSTCAVGSYPSGNSPFGLADMSGNVWEWTSSAYNSSSLVLRGGGWNYRVAPSHVRSAFRGSGDPAVQVDYLGFRCAGSTLP
jgi:formylglycine-generating enzyme required for sulfatase activity